jgi:1-acyl-sn-glycerol-3-phosphate acyltransferase
VVYSSFSSEEPEVFLTVVKILALLPITLALSVLALISIPIDRTGRLFRWCPLMWSKSILRMFGIRPAVQGFNRLDPARSYVFVSNHASMFDIPTVVAALKGNVNIVFKKELTRVPIWGWALRYGHFIMIDRSNARDAMQSIERAAQSIRNGNSVILFPEGTRTKDGKLQSFKRGAFALAVKSGVPVVPLTINGTFKIMPKGSLKIRPADISVVIDEPIAINGFNGKAGELKLMEQVHAAIEKNYLNQ